MKQKFFLTILAIAFSVMSAFAQQEEKLVINAGNTKHITITGNLDVILMPGFGNEQSVLVDPVVSEKISLNFTDNALAVAPVNFSSSKKLTVYLYVNQLKSLVIQDNATVRTVGIINSPKLDLMVGGEARVHLRTNGNVKARSIYDAEIKVEYLSANGVAKQSLTKNWYKF